ncbi:signal recognition particle-docking protein FtsY [Rickettsiales endosymbiont of Stachyamoeba lipophora]|uniref:signal recognition particle-docking protein FtsY n=1 Tax=Rickettsiales endosymbiont of Stachyamoeba lipophora TaxID=2486578 RepID=UPI000F654351|nr:signal recognition particle-docking protein FtsY [Rickettsiales endosymbiont of Stachyamoeba lipophora]AZL15240.1 signal recognition particle-docking protein FtsY [Rickettsiales endosymbiont of Stachyamoeba lipophora]
MTENLSWFNRIKQGLNATSNKISSKITEVFKNRKLDQETLDELQEVLIQADLGVKTSDFIINELASRKYNQDISIEEVKLLLKDIIIDILDDKIEELNITGHPHVIMVCGVNGNGKTTSIAKLANYYQQQGKKVLLAACDTFRAAAIEQLLAWANRINCPVEHKEPESDPASVAYKAVERAKNEGFDVVIIDTAGRLHNKTNLMEELAKIKRVIQKIEPNAPNDTILVLDGTTGQNAFRQLEEFQKIVEINGLIITKLDGTAKGGVVIGLAKQYNVKLRAIGVGEKIDDLRPFNAQDFAKSIVGLE